MSAAMNVPTPAESNGVSPSMGFTDLCHAFCKRLGTNCPPLQAADAPVPGLRLAIGGIEVELLQAAAHDPAWGLLLVHLGDLPGGQEGQAHLTLLQANFMLMGPTPAVFAVHPVSGSAILYQSFHVGSVTAERLELAARELLGMAVRWRRGEFLGTAETPPTPAPVSFGAHSVHLA